MPIPRPKLSIPTISHITNPNNEPAFPRPNPNYDGNWDKRTHIEGMSLRDYFAAKALAGIMADPYRPNQILDNEVAALSYRIADAMLEARKK